MRVTRRVVARTAFDEHALDALAGNVRRLVLADQVTLAFFDFGASARTFPNGGWRQQRTEDAFHGALPRVWRMRDQAAACERRNHSSKPMRPRRASPNGTSENSSTRPPK
jgi:hypothetical protein